MLGEADIFSLFEELFKNGWLGLEMFESNQFQSYLPTLSYLNINKSKSLLAKIFNLRQSGLVCVSINIKSGIEILGVFRVLMYDFN